MWGRAGQRWCVQITGRADSSVRTQSQVRAVAKHHSTPPRLPLAESPSSLRSPRYLASPASRPGSSGLPWNSLGLSSSGAALQVSEPASQR